MDQVSGAAALRHDEGAGAAVIRLVRFGLVQFGARRSDDLGTRIDHDDVFEGDARALGDAAHFLDVALVELGDAVGIALDQSRLALCRKAELVERAAIQVGAAPDTRCQQHAVLPATLEGAARNGDEGKGFDRHWHSTGASQNVLY